MRFIYLHGFASSPRSRKALAFSDALNAHGIELEVPDLSDGAFERLTISGQLQVLENTLQGSPCRLIGSSMGGYLAALYAAVHPEVQRLVLLAPAFAFVSRWRSLWGEEGVARWKDTGWLEVFHYGDRAMRKVHYDLLQDAAAYPDYPDFSQPAIIFHGVNDNVVPVQFSREFNRLHANAVLRELASDHELLDALGAITAEGVPYITSDTVFLPS